MSELEPHAASASEVAVALVDQALAEVVQPGTPTGAGVAVADLGLRRDDLQRLSELLLRGTGVLVMPAAVTWCETVQDLYALVDRVLARTMRSTSPSSSPRPDPSAHS